MHELNASLNVSSSNVKSLLTIGFFRDGASARSIIEHDVGVYALSKKMAVCMNCS